MRWRFVWLGGLVFVLLGCSNARGNLNLLDASREASQDRLDGGSGNPDDGPGTVRPRDASDDNRYVPDVMRQCAAEEQCNNGLDDDCDGNVDEACDCRPGDMQPCYDGPSVFAGIGACQRGMQRCGGSGEFGRWESCVGSGRPDFERCDRLDNDCDGTVDEGCECEVGRTRGCYTGPPAMRGVGICVEGQQTCVEGPSGEGSAWGPCAGDRRPDTEACDGVDNDCDGTVDNGCACTGGMMRSCYSGATGTMGVGACVAGTQRCESASGANMWGTCTGQVLPQGERCDGVDNDCNGVVDNGCDCRPGETRPCYEGPSATRNVGVCIGGTQTCETGPMATGSRWSACVGQRTPTMEVCDGMDNNCDGMTDETCVCRMGDTRRCYSGPSGTDRVGICIGGRQSCEYSGGVARWGNCVGEVIPRINETCGNGLDDNCNGEIDDGCLCREGETSECYSGDPADLRSSACSTGTRGCMVAAGVAQWGACTGEATPTPERCDRIDNDCDGTVDEGCLCVADSTRQCYRGPANTLGRGQCISGRETCTVRGTVVYWSDCVGDVWPSTEVCDGRDNDCNGLVDEGCPCTAGMTRTCYGGPMGTQGVGRCQAGSQACVAGSWGPCTSQVVPQTETCNNQDDDCNGFIDDGTPCGAGPAVTCPAGVTVPAGQAVSIAAVVSGASTVQWTVVSGPGGGTFTPANAANTSFRGVLVGMYQLQITATDSTGRTASCVTTVNTISQGLRIELTWSNGASGRAVDLDLHTHNNLATRWFSSPNDCYFSNRNPNWDSSGAGDNPSLDTDNTVGLGPENIRVDQPVIASQTYTVGVHAWSISSSYSPRNTTATVRIYCGPGLAQTFMRTLTVNSSDLNLNDFWRVARVTFTTGTTCTVTAVDDIITRSAANAGSP